jgi:N-acetyl-anhydromuramyl-L-alanine amidase AmpD
MPDYKSALWMPNSNFFPDTGKKSFLILHSTAGGSSAQGIASYFQGTQDSNNPVSSHYIVGKDGTVVQTVLEKDGAYGNGVVNNPNWTGNPNYYTISIEHVKSQADNSDALTPEQQSASFALIKDICQRNGIGMHDADNNTGITGHFSIDPVNRARCPGNYPWDALWNYLNSGNQEEQVMATIPAGWHDDGTTLIAPNGHKVVAGFRGWVLTHNWDSANQPDEDEQHCDPLEQSNPSLGAGQRQRFRWKTLEYTDKTGVFEAWTGPELLWYQQRVTQLDAEIALIEKQLGDASQTALGQQVAILKSQVATLQKELDANAQAQENTALKAKIAAAIKALS